MVEATDARRTTRPTNVGRTPSARLADAHGDLAESLPDARINHDEDIPFVRVRLPNYDDPAAEAIVRLVADENRVDCHLGDDYAILVA